MQNSTRAGSHSAKGPISLAKVAGYEPIGAVSLCLVEDVGGVVVLTVRQNCRKEEDWIWHGGQNV